MQHQLINQQLIYNNMRTFTQDYIDHAIIRDIEKTKGKFFTVTFIKKDGTLRKMTCRTGVSKGVTGKGLDFDPKAKNLKVVWAADAQGFRMINLTTIISLKCNNIRIIY